MLLFLILLVKISRHFKSFTFEAKSQTVDELESHDANVLPMDSTDASLHLLNEFAAYQFSPKVKKITERNTEVNPDKDRTTAPCSLRHVMSLPKQLPPPQQPHFLGV